MLFSEGKALLQVGLFLDHELWLHFNAEYPTEQDAENEMIDFALALINQVHLLYQQPTMTVPIDLVIVRFEIWKIQPVSNRLPRTKTLFLSLQQRLSTGRHKNGQAQLLLNEFCDYQSAMNPGTDRTNSQHWDHAILLTG